MRFARAAAAWALAILVLGCASRGSSGNEGTRDSNAEVALEVENHNWSDIVIYLMRGTAAHRLGMVTSLSTKHFIFPYRHLGTSGSTRLRAYPIGGPSGFTSEDLLVQPGQWIKWTLESDLTRSSLSVY